MLAIDHNRRIVEEIKESVDLAVKLDSTDKAALESQDLNVLVVAIGENFETALLTTVITRQLNVPQIICRAQTQFHAEVFLQIGADEVIQLETQMGEQLARQLSRPYLADYVPLGGGYTLIELRAPKAFHQKSLSMIGLRKEYGVNLIAIKRPLPNQADAEQTEVANQEEKEELIPVPSPDGIILPHDVLIIVGPDDALATLPRE